MSATNESVLLVRIADLEAALAEAVGICSGMRTTMRQVADTLFDRQAGRVVSDTRYCDLRTTASAWAGAGGCGSHPLVVEAQARQLSSAPVAPLVPAPKSCQVAQFGFPFP
jgi:hypothetical protein